MPAEHDATYLHKVASAPIMESFPHDDTEPIEAVTLADAVSPPKNVLAGELISLDEDAGIASPADGAPAKPGLAPEAEAEPASGQSLLADAAATREKWMRLQASFVDDPRAAVTEGAAMISDVLAQLEAAVRSRQRTGGDTEALRLQMRQYRLLLDRLTGL